MRLILISVLLSWILNSTFAQDEWQISISAGTVSSQFLAQKPLGHQLEGRVSWFLYEDLSLTLTTGWHKWQKRIFTDIHSFEAVPVLPGIKFQMPSDILSPYFAAETGIFFITRNFLFEAYKLTHEGTFNFLYSEPAEESVSKFGYRVSIGAAAALMEYLELDLSVRYSNIYYDVIYFYPIQEATSGLNVYSLIVGLNIRL